MLTVLYKNSSIFILFIYYIIPQVSSVGRGQVGLDVQTDGCVSQLLTDMKLPRGNLFFAYFNIIPR